MCHLVTATAHSVRSVGFKTLTASCPNAQFIDRGISEYPPQPWLGSVVVSDMRHTSGRFHRHPPGWLFTLLLGIAVTSVGGAGYTLATYHMAGWVVVIAAAAVIATGWSEGRHIAAAKRDITGLGMVPGPRRPDDDNPQYLTDPR
jgi:hypothetical protein